ncbi:MAG: transcription-repair coupling factor [Treponema sp.]|nr:transcription-repair coupling factor [Treponema sp.]
MNTLLTNFISTRLHDYSGFQDYVNKLANDEADFPAVIEGLQGSLSSFFTASYVQARKYKIIHELQYKGSASASLSDIVIIVQNEKNAAELYTDLTTIFDENECEIWVLPWWGSVPYRPVAKGAKIFGERAGVLSRLLRPNNNVSISSVPRIFIISQRVLQSPLPAPEYLAKLSFWITKGQSFDSASLAKKLTTLGYTRVPRVSVCGEYALRGEVLDIFLPGESFATRIQFDFDSVEQIKSFDVLSQSTVKTSSSDKILIYPMKELVWNEELIDKLEEKLNANDATNVDENGVSIAFTDLARAYADNMILSLHENKEASGEELFYPLLWDCKYSIFDYLKEDTTVIYTDYDRLINAEEGLEKEYNGLYRKSRQTMPVMPPSKMLLKFENLFSSHKRNIIYKSLHTEINETENNELSESSNAVIKIEAEAARSFFNNINYLKEQLADLIKDDWNIVIYADNPSQALRISELLKDYLCDKLRIEDKAITEGFCIPDIKLLVIQENEIFSRRKHAPKSIHKGVKSEAIDTFVELNPGDYVVHVNYGIGLFKGIERVNSMGNERDYIKLIYANDDVVFVPIEQVNLVQRYIGNEGNKPRLDRLGSKSWENRKNKVQKSVEDLAQHLIDLYSRRKASVGFAFPKENEWQTAFEASFPYEDTPDQASVTAEIKADMEKAVPMDRLVCGDVGYGKTEIAMRAAFKAVMGGKQVAFLAPTTILAEQHYETCIERFADFPVKIAQMSRFVSNSEQKKILEKLAAGEIDILVGTHRIIQKDVHFKDLGLMIIDEEQRFGVKDKEKLKEMKNNIDSLAMSATPIPRTLHMSLLKIRDMSLLTTPPQNRQPIETVIDAYSDDRVAEAIRREVKRGGQVFYLHNRVETLEETRIKLERLLPEMIIDTAHGQMTSEQLDDIFRRFKMGGFHVLVATTIIENGIDIPNVNTIIIDRADMYGVSQLYQLRGRVGRSDRKAYAYLLYPENKSLTEVAMKRLQVISDFTELGSGFKIAMKDMEIRGAGNLLGKDQSGEVYSVGFDMYLRLLNEAVARLSKSEEYKKDLEVLLELDYTGFIPESYIQSPQIKMEVYKKIAAVQNGAELEALEADLLDRFGPVPDEVYSLLSLSKIRIVCRKLSIKALREKKGEVRVEFYDVKSVPIEKLMKLMKSANGKVGADPKNPNIIILKTGSIGLDEKCAFIREKLESLI